MPLLVRKGRGVGVGVLQELEGELYCQEWRITAIRIELMIAEKPKKDDD